MSKFTQCKTCFDSGNQEYSFACRICEFEEGHVFPSQYVHAENEKGANEMAFENNFPKVSENTLSQIVGEKFEGNTCTALFFENGMKIEKKFYQNFDEVAKQYFDYKFKNRPVEEVMKEFGVPEEAIETLSKKPELEYSIEEMKEGLEAIQNMYEPEILTAPSAYDIAVLHGDKCKINKDDSFNALGYSLQAFGPATTEGTKKPVIDPLKEINNIIVDTFKNPLIQAKKDAETYEKKFNKVVEQARYWKGQYKLMSGYHDDELANVESYQKWYKELELKFKHCQEKSESFQAANKILGETVERAAKLNSDMKIKVDRLEERLATELAKNFDMNFKSAIDRIKQQKDELKKRGKEIIQLQEDYEKLKKKFDSETIALYELVGELANEIESKDLLIETYEARKKADLETMEKQKKLLGVNESALEGYRTSSNKMRGEIDSLTNDNNLLKNKVTELLEENKKIKDQVSLLKPTLKHNCKNHGTPVFNMNVVVRVVCEKCGAKLWSVEDNG